MKNTAFIIRLTSVAMLLYLPITYAEHIFTGIVWHDTNHDGIRSVTEQRITNGYAYIVHKPLGGPWTYVTNNIRSDGTYWIRGTNTTGKYDLGVSVGSEYRNTLVNIGFNDNIDSDFDVSGIEIDISNITITNYDAGFRLSVPSFSATLLINDAPVENHYYATNGQIFKLNYTVLNTGESQFSPLTVYETINGQTHFITDCPAFLHLGRTTQAIYYISITNSFTNISTVIGVPVDPNSCIPLPLNYIYWATQTVFTVVISFIDYDGDLMPNDWELNHGFDHLLSNAPNSNADADWMTDVEEYFAGTDATNSNSYFPNVHISETYIVIDPTSPNRIYSTWSLDESLNNPQNWNLLHDEMTGTGSSVSFTITNPADHKIIRTGVRPP